MKYETCVNKPLYYMCVLRSYGHVCEDSISTVFRQVPARIRQQKPQATCSCMSTLVISRGGSHLWAHDDWREFPARFPQTSGKQH